MPECNYCGDSFEDEQSHLRHLRDEHGGELGAIDRRRVEEELDAGGSGLPTGPLVLGSVLVVSMLVVAYVVFFMGGGEASPASTNGPDVDDEAALSEIAQTPGPMDSAHEHGPIEMVVDGREVDFSRSEYQLQADKFHFENGDGRVWHTHATGVTLEWAMATLDIGVSEDVVIFEGEVYRDEDPGTSVTVEVNGEPVDPQTYVLEGTADANAEQGDHVRIVVETDGGNGG